ncbi:MAG: hypothetical protein HWE27_14095 [Gammaproteobacteria bacterium]|nr:hypothetical protein [Gammaproteobacteria bacterium]
MSNKPKLLLQVRTAIRAKHYSNLADKSYIQWIKRYIFFHEVKHLGKDCSIRAIKAQLNY